MLNMESVDSLQPTPKASLGYTASETSIAQDDKKVNTKISISEDSESDSYSRIYVGRG